MTGARKSRSSLYIGESNFAQLILSKIFYLVLFSCMNYHLTGNIKLKNVLLNKLSSNVNLEKHRRIVLCCLR